MAASVQHISNRVSDSDAVPRPFRYDLNNVAALQSARLQKKLMEEAARQQQQQIAAVTEDKEKVIQERDALLVEKERLHQAIQKMDDSLSASESSLAGMQRAKEEAERQTETIRQQKDAELATVREQKATGEAEIRRSKDIEIANCETQKQLLLGQVNTIPGLNGEIQTLKTSINEMNQRYAFGGKENCLPMDFHDIDVMIVNVRSHLAIDAGKGETRFVILMKTEP